MTDGAPSTPLRVLVIDDHAIVRCGVRALLQAAGGITVDEADSLTAAVRTVRRHMPDIVLLDLNLPGSDGIETIGRLRDEAPSCHVVILSIDDDPWRARRALAEGARGYVLKDAAANELLAAVRDVAGGRGYISPRLGARVVLAEMEATANPRDRLSPRQDEVFRLLAYGHTNAEIAGRLTISVRTAERHRRAIMHKMGLASRAEIIECALERGILERRATA